MIKYRVSTDSGYIEFATSEDAEALAIINGGSVSEIEFELPSPDIKDVTPRQMKQALILSGVSLAAIDAALDSLSEPTKSLAKVEWEYSISFQRNRPLVAQVGAMLGWSSAQLDALWHFAATL